MKQCLAAFALFGTDTALSIIPAQVVPFDLITLPPSPTAYTALAELPHTPFRLEVVLLVIEDQVVPLDLITLPPLPTAYTLLAELPHTPFRSE